MPVRRALPVAHHADAPSGTSFLLIACGLSVGILCGFVVGVAFEVSREVNMSAALPDPFLPSFSSALPPALAMTGRSRGLGATPENPATADAGAGAFLPASVAGAPVRAKPAAAGVSQSTATDPEAPAVTIPDAIAIARGRRPAGKSIRGRKQGVPSTCRAVSRTVDAAHDRGAAWQYWPSSTVSSAECFWTRMEQAGTQVGYDVCTHDPTVDTAVSAAMHAYHNFAAYADTVMWSTRATCDAFSVRNTIIDVGAGFGLATSIFASSGCNVIATEAADENVALGMRTLDRLSGEASSRVSWVKGVPYPHPARLYSVFTRDNAYASYSSTREMPQLNTRPVAGLPLSSLFTWEERPVNPRTKTGVTPDDVLLIKLDVQGLNMLALDELRTVLSASRIPYISLTLRKEGIDGGACSPTPIVRFMYSLGYMGFEGSAYVGHSLAWWEAQGMDAPSDKSWFVTFVHTSALPASSAALQYPLSLAAEAEEAYSALQAAPVA